jgi:glutathione S-transferase
MLTILGRISSSNVQKIQWCCDELGLAYEQQDAGHGVRNHDADYLAMNPNGLVPTIIDDGFVLWESNAIIEYLASKHGVGSLYPDDLPTRALACQWMDWTNTVAIPARRALHRTMNVPPPEERDPQAIAAARDGFTSTMRMLDDRLGASRHLTGDGFTMGDMPAGVVAHQWYGFDIDHGNMPNLKRWYEGLAGRPAYRKHVMGDAVSG